MKRFPLLISLAAAAVLLLPVVGPFAGPAGASIITTGDVDPGGAGSQPDPWAVAGILKVGDSGNGTLNVAAGGVVTNGWAYMGSGGGSTGEVTVTGSGSQWNNSGVLSVGRYGSGTLNVEAGGVVSNMSEGHNSYIANYSGSTGVATVTGKGSQWNNTSWLSVGYFGTGTLKIADGGVVSNSSGELGDRSGSTGMATVTGANSQWNNSGVLSVGSQGGGTLNVEVGGVVSNSAGYIGNSTGATGVATVTGTGSEWNNSDALYVATMGAGTLNVEAGGVVSNSAGYIGNSTGATGVATVTGTGSEWNNSDALYVATMGAGTLDVEAGGVVSNRAGYIGRYSGSTGEATVTGANSQWNNSDDLWIGGNASEAGGAGTLNLYDSGLVTVAGTTKLWDTGTVYLAYGAKLTTGSFDNSEGGNFHFDGTLTVNGASGVFDPGTDDFTIDGLYPNHTAHLVIANTATTTLAGALFVGDVWNMAPYRGFLTVESGGVVSTYRGFIGNSTGSTGVATVTGSGSQWNNSDVLYVGAEGTGTLNVTDGGEVTSTGGIIGYGPGEVTVTGADSQWTNSSGLVVGRAGTGTLNVADGGVVSNTTGILGYGTHSTGVATVTGTGSQWNNSGFLSVGNYGTGTLNVTDGGIVANTNGRIGDESGSTGEATVSGANSRWSSSSDLHVGYAGTGTLNVTDGGVVLNTDGRIGDVSGSTGVATITGLGSQWNNSGRMYVGWFGDGTLNMEAGGLVTNNGPAYIARTSASTGAVTVVGASSQWNGVTDLHVGFQGTGTFRVEAEGVVSNADGYIGRDSGSTGLATVTGTGSHWTNSGNLRVGMNGTGTLNIENEGRVTVGGTTSIGTSGTVNLTGGRFEFGQTTLAEFSTINATSGSMAGDVMITGVNDVASLTALQNSAVDLNDVAAVNEGLLHGSAILNSSLDNQASGELRALAGDWIRFEGSGNTNAGGFEAIGGEIEFTKGLDNSGFVVVTNGTFRVGGPTANAVDGVISGRNTYFRFGGGLTNDGDVGLSFGVHDILGSIVNTATGRIMVAGQSTVTFYDNVTNDGDIFTGEGSQSVFLGDVTGGGNFPGAGIVEFAGAISPGSSPASVSFGGDVVLGSLAEVKIELGGTVRGDEYDAMIVSGDFMLDGSFSVLSIGGFVPQAGDLFDIFDFEPANLSGVFDVVNLPALASGLAWDDTNLYTTGELLVLLSQIAGDFDSDGDVDGDDFLLWQRNFPILDGTAGSSSGDANDDGDVDGDDFLVWQRNFPYPTAISSIPEPNSLVLLAISGLLMRKCRRT